jgi:flagellar biosynthetic protein FliP
MGTFMFRFARDKDVALFSNMAGLQRPKNEGDIPFRVLVPAFAISELKRAFQIGFLLYIPFLIIDMVVASVLLSTGMMMLPPIFISLPFKLMLFVLVDGWNLLVGSLVKGFL